MKQNQLQLEQIEELNQTISDFNATIKELREQVKNSGNISCYSSTVGFMNALKSLREKNGKKRGRVKLGKILALNNMLQKYKGG